VRRRGESGMHDFTAIGRDGYDPRGPEPDPDRWVDWDREAADRTAMHDAAISAGCTEKQATTLLLLTSGVSVREIAAQRGQSPAAVRGVRDRAMRRILKRAGGSVRLGASHWAAHPPDDGLTSKQR
jgi:DNA-binding CsgD family transcriptional regulator